MSPCYQGHIDCNENEKNATKNQMQSNTKHEFECFKGQGIGKTTKQDRLKKMLKNERDEYGIRHITMPI
jgi:hypothetical protein